MSVLARNRRRRPPQANPALAADLLEQLPYAVVACDAEGEVVVFNQRARELYEVEGAASGCPHELPLTRALGGEEIRDLAVEPRRSGGGRRVLSVSGGPVRDAGGAIAGALFAMHDVTARIEQDEIASLQSALAAGLAAGLVVFRADDGEIVYVNAAWERMFGYAGREAVGRHISMVSAPSEHIPGERANEIVGALERDGAWTGEVHSVRKDGTRFWSAANMATLSLPGHGAVWVATHTDISRRRQEGDALRVAEQRFRGIFEEGPIGIALMDEDLRVADANRAFATLTGYPREELVGRPFSDLRDPDGRADDAGLRAMVLGGERRRGLERFVTRNGDTVELAMTATVVRAQDGHALCGLIMVEEPRGS